MPSQATTATTKPAALSAKASSMQKRPVFSRGVFAVSESIRRNEPKPAFADCTQSPHRSDFDGLRRMDSLTVPIYTRLVLPEPELGALYQALNREFFDDELPPCSIKWSRRLTRAAGNIRVQTRLITLSLPLLCDVWKPDGAFEVCGVRCASPEAAVREILKHEMIHLWLFEHGLPCGHTREFRVKARQIGQPKTRHGIELPAPKSGWVYECALCGAQVFRRRRFGRRVACARCSGRGYDERFRLRGRRLQNAGEAREATR